MIKEALEGAESFIGELPLSLQRDIELKRIIEALTELEKSEPVAWMDADGEFWTTAQRNIFPALTYTPLYTSPPEREWVGLSDEEVRTAYSAICEKEWAIGGMEYAEPFARAIEAKLKELNTLSEK